jgi:hypothetical protein
MGNDFFEQLTNYKLMVAIRTFQPLIDLGFNSNTKISEIFKKYDSTAAIRTEIESRIKIAPKDSDILPKIILDYEQQYEHVPIVEYWVDGFIETGNMQPRNWPSDYLAYSFIKKGIDAELEYFSNQLIDCDKQNKYFSKALNIEITLKEIAKGITIAYLLPDLKNEYSKIIAFEIFNDKIDKLNFDRKASSLINDFIVKEEVSKRLTLIHDAPLSFQIERLNINVDGYKERLFPTRKSPKFHQPLFEQIIIENIANGMDFNLSEIQDEYKLYLKEKHKNFHYSNLPNITLEKLEEQIGEIATNSEIYRQLNEKLEQIKHQSIDRNKEDKIQDIIGNTTVKLKWLGTPSQFGFIIQELIGKGFIERPSSSYPKDAAVYLNLFEIETTAATLAKEISTGEGQNSLSSNSRAHIKIPQIGRLK